MTHETSRRSLGPLYIGLDLGSSRSKVVVIDAAGQLLGILTLVGRLRRAVGREEHAG